MEKKYPGTYKRHLVRPIVRSNAVEKLIKKKGSISHKPGMPPTKRSEALGIIVFSSTINYSICCFNGYTPIRNLVIIYPLNKSHFSVK